MEVHSFMLIIFFTVLLLLHLPLFLLAGVPMLDAGLAYTILLPLPGMLGLGGGQREGWMALVRCVSSHVHRCCPMDTLWP